MEACFDTKMILKIRSNKKYRRISYTPLYVNVDGEVLYGEWIDME